MAYIGIQYIMDLFYNAMYCCGVVIFVIYKTMQTFNN